MKSSIAISCLLLLLWAFPRAWYTRTDPTTGAFWLSEEEQVPGWAFKPVAVDASAERALVADRLVSGDLTRLDGGTVQVFSANRYSEKQNEIGLFVHTPDRCWTENGWRIEPTAPDVVEVVVHGIKVQFERRIFLAGGRRELVYFGGMVGGQPLPYRLDHNLGVGMKVALRDAKGLDGSKSRASDSRLWTRVWESFTARRPLLGPKQFIRVSTQLTPGRETEADALLREALHAWLKPVEYARRAQ